MQSDRSGPARVVIYAAKSTADTHGSIESQIAACREYATQQGWEVVEPAYSDEAASAYHGSRGKGLVDAKRRAAELASEGGDVLLLVYATDRLARGDGRKAAHLVEHVLDGLKAGYRIESVTENLGGDLALVFASLYGERAHADSAAKAAHTKRGVRQRVERGHHHGGIAPYGFNVVRDRNDPNDRGHLVVVPDEAEIIRRIHRLFLAGHGVRGIARELNADAVPPPSAKKPVRGRRCAAGWDGSQIRKILTSPLYVGLVHVNGETFEGEHPAIVDRETWEEVQRLRAAKAGAGGGAGRHPAGRHLLVKGLLRCGLCGAAMRPRTYRHRNREVYVCSTHDGHHATASCPMLPIDRSEVDEALLEHFETVSLDLDATREQLTGAAIRARAEAQARHDAADRELLLANERLGRVRRDYQDGKIDAYDWRDQRAELEAEQAAAAGELERWQRRAAEIDQELAAIDVESELVSRLAILRAAVAGSIAGSGDLEALRAAVTAAFQRVELVVSDDGERDLVTYVRTDPDWKPTPEQAEALRRAAEGDISGYVHTNERRVGLGLGPVDNVDTSSSLSVGSNELLRLGAAPLTRAEDVLASFGILPAPGTAAVPDGPAAGLLELLRRAPAGADELARLAGLPASEAARLLVELELAGLVSTADGVYRPAAL